MSFAQVNWTEACRLASKKDVKYADLAKTLPVRRDLALLVDRTVTYADIEKVVEQSEKHYLKGVNLFDVYEGKNLEAGKKSYAVNFTLQSDEKTLNDKAIEAIMNKIEQNICKSTAAVVRGK